MKTYNVCDDGILRQVADGDIGFWVKTIDYENDLAAKDARIAELQSILRDALRCGFEGYNVGLGKTLREVAECAIASQQQAEPKECKSCMGHGSGEWGKCSECGVPATPSEDGREVPEVVKLQHMAVAEEGRLRWMTGRKIRECELYAMPDFGSLREPLMTVAQHSRIVAAKDAEIARLKAESSHHANQADAYLMQRDAARRERDAQPARQVGGDEREQFETWFLSRWPANELYRRDDLPASHPQYDEYFNPRPRHSFEGWMARAALAPAVVVMPEKKYPKDWNSPALGQANMDYIEGHNDALDEVARLNRNAIPVGLLEKLAHCTDPDCCIAHARGELRAMLGKGDA